MIMVDAINHFCLPRKGMYEIFPKTMAKVFIPLTGLLYLSSAYAGLAQLVSNQVGQPLGYFWTLLFLEAGYLVLVFHW